MAEARTLFNSFCHSVFLLSVELVRLFFRLCFTSLIDCSKEVGLVGVELVKGAEGVFKLLLTGIEEALGLLAGIEEASLFFGIEEVVELVEAVGELVELVESLVLGAEEALGFAEESVGSVEFTEALVGAASLLVEELALEEALGFTENLAGLVGFVELPKELVLLLVAGSRK